MINKEYLKSLKTLVEDEERALGTYRKMLEDRYSVTSSNSNSNMSSDSSGNIQEIAYEQLEDDSFEL